VLASCGPAAPGEQEEEEEEEEIAPAGEQEEEEEEEEEEEVAPAAGEPQQGGTLTVAHMGVFVTEKAWNPQSGWWGADMSVSPYLERAFVGDVSRGQTGTGETTFGGRYIATEFLTGQLCESWEVLTDPLRIVWQVKPGIMWSEAPIMEAREFTADDIAFTINNRMDDPIKGREGDARWEFVDTVTATAKYEVTIKVNYVFPDWAFMLSFGQDATIVPPELAEAGADDWHNHLGIGTGPWELVNVVPDSLHEYERSPSYRRVTTTINGKEYVTPFVDKLVLPVITDQGTVLAAMRTGKLDIWEQVPWVYADTLESSCPDLRKWEVDTWDAYDIYILQLEIAPLNNLMVRQAMNMAIDRQYILDNIYGGYGVMLNNPFPRSYPETLYTPLEKCPAAVQELFTYDLDKAKELMGLAGYADGFKTTVNIKTDPIQVDVMSLVKDYWSDIGIDVEIVALDDATWWSQEAVRPPEVPMVAQLESHGSPGHCLLGDFVVYSQVDPVWDNPELFDKINRWRRESPTLEEQNTLAKEICLYTLEQSPAFILPGPNGFRYAWPWVKNYEGETASKYMSATELWQIAWIDQEMKADMGY